MLTPSPDIIQLLQALSPCFTKPTFHKVLVLLYGAILAPGKRTVSAALRVLGLECVQYFRKVAGVARSDTMNNLGMFA